MLVELAVQPATTNAKAIPAAAIMAFNFNVCVMLRPSDGKVMCSIFAGIDARAPATEGPNRETLEVLVSRKSV